MIKHILAIAAAAALSLQIAPNALAEDEAKFNITGEQLKDLIDARVHEILKQENLTGKASYDEFERKLQWYSQKKMAEQRQQEEENRDRAAKNVPPITDKDHILGDPNAPIKIIEYSSFDCGYCKKHHATMNSIVEKYSNVAWVYRHYRVFSERPPKALISECIAQKSGNETFWSYSDYVMNNQVKTDEEIKQSGLKFGLTEEEISNCLVDEKVFLDVVAMSDGGQAAGVTGTPGNFVVTDSETIPLFGAVPESEFEQLIESLSRK